MRADDDDSGFPEIPGYKITGVLGRGSMAVVYRATQRSVGRDVALKVLHRDIAENQRLVRRLMREAKIAASLNHPAVVRALDAGVHEGACYFAMDLVEGESLRDRLQRAGPLSEEEALRLAIRIGEALNAFHRAHIVHRDIKPANVMLTIDGEALLADLGLAKEEFDTTTTSKDRTVGTPQYMSPEQIRDPESVDVRSDIFSLGATLYHAVTGKSPFEAPGVGAVLTRILYENPAPIREVAPEISAEFSEIVDRMLRKDRDERYPTPSVLLRDLRALAHGRAPPGVEGRIASRRRRVAVAVMIAVGLVVGIGVAYSIWPRSDDGDRELERRDRTEDARPADFDYRSASDRDVAYAASDGALGQEARDAATRELSRRLEELIGEHLRRARAKLSIRSYESAHAAIHEELDAAVTARFGAVEMPEWARERIAVARDRVDVERAEAVRSDREVIIDAARTAVDEVYSRLLARDSFLDRVAAADEFAAIEFEDLDALGSREPVDAHIARRLDDLFAEWRRRADAAADEIEDMARAGRIAPARKALRALRARHPERLGVAGQETLRRAERTIEKSETRLVEAADALIASCDRLGALGHPELAERRFDGVIAALDGYVSQLPADRDVVGTRIAERLRTVDALLDAFRAARDALIGLPFRLEALNEPAVFVLRDGRRFEGVRIVSAGAESVRLEHAGRPPLEVAYSDLDAATIVRCAESSNEVERRRLLAILAYCDSDFFRAETAAMGLPFSDPMRSVLLKRIRRAQAELERVNTPEERAAYEEWSSIIRDSYLRGRWDDVARRVRVLMNRKSWAKTEWYARHRRRIREVYEEATNHRELAEMLAGREAFVEVLDGATRQVAFTWDFRASQIRDFEIPEGVQIVGGAARRIRPEAPGVIAPHRIGLLTTHLPIDLTSSPATVEFTYATDADVRWTPRVLVVRVCGHDFVLVSRLRHGSHLRHLALHGLERDLHEMVPIGLAAYWRGPLADYERHFTAKLSKPPVLILEPGQSYEVRAVVEPKSRIARLEVNGNTLLRASITETGALDDAVSLGAPMPHRILHLRVRGAIRRNP